ncbi:MAG: cytochrome c [Pseudomonadota bacterium]|nr:cytochrome c [Pseudomonadota bacterium]
MLRKSFLAWAAIAFFTAAALPAAAEAQSPPPDNGAPAGQVSSVAATIERGKYLATAGNCISCHTRPDGVAFAGGRAFSTPFGTIYSTNITPDDETGIGTWKAEDMRRAMHEGVAPDGRRLFPAFPYTSFTKVTDADVDAIHAYLQSLKPVRYTPPDNGILFWQRWPMRLWNAFFFEPGRFTPDASQTDEWNRGAYLVDGLGHCSACHTPRNRFMAEVSSRAYAGGSGIMEEVAKDQLRPWSGANLTSAKEGLAAWSVGDLTKYLKTGFSARAGTFGPMNDVIVNSTREMTTEDVRAMAVYIKSLPAHDSATATVTADQAKAGESIYKARCEKCHMSSGRGGMFTAPPLSGSAVVQTDDPASLLNIVLFGPTVPKEVSLGAWETMKGYHEILSDDDTAKLANYLRGSWGNRGRPVTAEDVKRQRGTLE